MLTESAIHRFKEVLLFPGKPTVQTTPILGQDDDRLLKAVMGHYDVPAYVRRARRVEDAL